MGATTVGKLSKFRVLSNTADNVAEDDDYNELSVRAILVGQGDCNAIIGSNDLPLIYFDCGGGCGKGAETYPWHPSNSAPVGRPSASDAFDFTNDPYIFLSHWDHDHFYSAENVAGLRQRTFIAPRQKVSGSYVDFVEKNLTVRFWPNDAPPKEFQINGNFSLIVERCTGLESGNRNYSGLALTLIKMKSYADDDESNDEEDFDEEEEEDEETEVDQDQAVQTDDDESDIDGDIDDGVALGTDISDWPVNPEDHDQYILMPGDAPYQFIRTLAADDFRTSGKYVAIFAYHHGSKTKWTVNTNNHIPVPMPPRDEDDDRFFYQCGYTYGLKRNNMSPYHVPAASAIANLRAMGWTNRLNTSGNTADDAVLSGTYHMPGLAGGDPFNTRDDRTFYFTYSDDGTSENEEEDGGYDEEDEEDEEEDDDYDEEECLPTKKKKK